jgi:hypothetical protein
MLAFDSHHIVILPAVCDPRCGVMRLVWLNHQVVEAERLPKVEISMEK